MSKKTLEDSLSEYGADRAFAYRELGDGAEYSTRATELKDEARAAIKALFMEVIGPDEELTHSTADYTTGIVERNNLRAELRKAVGGM